MKARRGHAQAIPGGVRESARPQLHVDVVNGTQSGHSVRVLGEAG